MTLQLKLGTPVAGLFSSLSRHYGRRDASIVEADPMLITESYCDLPECRHSCTRRNS
jgi:hypothetical protein